MSAFPLADACPSALALAPAFVGRSVGHREASHLHLTAVSEIARHLRHDLVARFQPSADHGRGALFACHLDGLQLRLAVRDYVHKGPVLPLLDRGRRHDEGVAFNIDLVARDALNDYPPFTRMGPEPLGQGFTGAALHAALKDKRAPIKAALLDQGVVAGLGNIYVCEALHSAGIAPGTQAGAIARGRVDGLVAAIRAVLESAIAAGGSTLRDYARPDGELGYFSKQWRVYGREGEDCGGCGTPVLRAIEGGRSTFWCGVCQK